MVLDDKDEKDRAKAKKNMESAHNALEAAQKSLTEKGQSADDAYRNADIANQQSTDAKQSLTAATNRLESAKRALTESKKKYRNRNTGSTQYTLVHIASCPLSDEGCYQISPPLPPTNLCSRNKISIPGKGITDKEGNLLLQLVFTDSADYANYGTNSCNLETQENQFTAGGTYNIKVPPTSDFSHSVFELAACSRDQNENDCAVQKCDGEETSTCDSSFCQYNYSIEYAGQYTPVPLKSTTTYPNIPVTLTNVSRDIYKCSGESITTSGHRYSQEDKTTLTKN